MPGRFDAPGGARGYHPLGRCSSRGVSLPPGWP